VRAQGPERYGQRPGKKPTPKERVKKGPGGRKRVLLPKPFRPNDSRGEIIKKVVVLPLNNRIIWGGVKKETITELRRT